jgi:hypothetical protein
MHCFAASTTTCTPPRPVVASSEDLETDGWTNCGFRNDEHSKTEHS